LQGRRSSGKPESPQMAVFASMAPWPLRKPTCFLSLALVWGWNCLVYDHHLCLSLQLAAVVGYEQPVVLCTSTIQCQHMLSNGLGGCV
jgi:hypothetical protein